MTSDINYSRINLSDSSDANKIEECHLEQPSSECSSRSVVNDLERNFKNVIVIGTNEILIEFLSVNLLIILKIKMLELFTKNLRMKLRDESLNLDSNSVEIIYTYLEELHKEVIIT